jgi:hypothetical protein
MMSAFKAVRRFSMRVDDATYQEEVAAISPLVQETLASDFA